ncbi:MAG: type I phosphomannose isomerase catalytic subunit [Candidatus Sumerlaeia bacterium]
MSEPFSSYPLLMEPWLSARPWGGRRLESLGKVLPPDGGPWGEAWELSDHPDGLSRIANGPYQGLGFGELVRRHPEAIGRSEPVARFPLLVKYIDANEDLSIQVHPDDAHAPAGELGKTECWYIMDCPRGAEIIHGLSGQIDAARLAEAARLGKMEACIRRVPIKPGVLIQIPAGTVHAILGGTLLCEIQQCSNTTYRLWDWDRKPARPLHVADACRVVDYAVASAAPVQTEPLEMNRWHTLAVNPYFEIATFRMPAQRSESIAVENPGGLILNIVEGHGRMAAAGFEAPLALGQTWFMPAGLEGWRFTTNSSPLRILASRSLE